MNSREAIVFSEKIAKYLLGIASAQEIKEVEDWAKLSEDNLGIMKEILSNLKHNEKLTHYAETKSLVDAKNLNAWKTIKLSIVGKYRFQKIKRVSYAAAVMALLIIGAFLYYQVDNKREIVKSTIALSSIKPGDDKATLYTEYGDIIYLDSIESKIIDSAKNITVNESTLSYNTIKPDNFKKKNRVKESEVYNRLVVPKGGRYHLILSDGSEVWLNSESTLRYYVYGRDTQRVVYLSGEAYFKIIKDEKRAFKVISNNNILKVLGTEFNIEAYSSRYVNTTLVNGSIKVSLEESDESVILDSPGLRAEVDNITNTINTRKVDHSIFTSWKEGVFKFNNTELEEMLLILSRWYNFEYIIINKTNKKYHFSGSFNRFDDLQTVIKIIELTGIPININCKENSLIISI